MVEAVFASRPESEVCDEKFWDMAGFVGVVDYIEFLYMAGLYPLVCIGCSNSQYLAVILLWWD